MQRKSLFAYSLQAGGTCCPSLKPNTVALAAGAPPGSCLDAFCWHPVKIQAERMLKRKSELRHGIAPRFQKASPRLAHLGSTRGRTSRVRVQPLTAFLNLHPSVKRLRDTTRSNHSEMKQRTKLIPARFSCVHSGAAALLLWFGVNCSADPASPGAVNAAGAGAGGSPAGAGNAKGRCGTGRRKFRWQH